MKYNISRFAPAIVIFVYLLLFLALRHPSQPWDRIINSDGKGYYAHLTSVFIYHDLSYRFVESYEDKYYPPDRSVFKEFRVNAGGKTVNKCFPGLAILWLPFFLAAHLLSFLFGFETDGYSILYQLSIAAAAFFYLWLGLLFLFRLLQKLGASPLLAGALVLVTGLGTNMIFFTVIEPSMTHVYSFCLITLFLYTTYSLFHSGDRRWLPLSVLLFMLIVLVRPTNGLVLLLVPAMSDGWKNFRETVRKIAGKPAVLLASVVIILVLAAIPLTIWYLQAGRLLVYSYGNETFNFLRPRAFSILFSYNRGWFIYTPVAFVSMAGFAGLYRSNRTRFWFLLVFLALFIYGASCWWMWYYASKMGQRVFIDILAIVAILLFYLRKSLTRFKKLTTALAALLILLTGLNLVQFYQHARFIFPPVYITRQIYWNSFFTLHRQARVFLPGEAITGSRTLFNDMEQAGGWMNPGTITDSAAFSGKRSSRVDASNPYSCGISEPVGPLFGSRNGIIEVTMEVLTKGGKTPSSLVIDFQQKGKSFNYNPFYLEMYARPGTWTRVEAAFYIPREMPDSSEVKIYVYNPSPEFPLFIDDMKIDFLTLKDDPGYRKIEGILLPAR
jgi:hypothetical protein